MKTSDLTVGDVYAVGRSRDRVEHAARLISTTSYKGAPRWSHLDDYEVTDLKFTSTRVPYGYPMAVVTTDTPRWSATQENVDKLTKIDLTKIEIKPGVQEVDGVKIRVQLFPSRRIHLLFAKYIEEQEAAKVARKQHEIAYLQKQRKIQKLAAELKQLLGDGVPHRVDSDGRVYVFDVEKLIERLKTGG